MSQLLSVETADHISTVTLQETICYVLDPTATIFALGGRSEAPGGAVAAFADNSAPELEGT